MTKQPKRLATVKKIPEHYNGAFTVAGLRWWIFNEKTNGFSQCVIRIGRKILIDLDAFEQWVADHGGAK